MRVSQTKAMINRVGVIIRDWPHSIEGNSYSSALFHVVDELRLAGKEVDFISFAHAYDVEWSRRLRERGEQYKAWDPNKWSVSDFLNLLSRYDVFITARYHGAVFASILGKPSIAIEIEQKMELVAALLGSGSRLWTYPFDAAQCLKYIDEFESNYFRSVECLNVVVEAQMCLATKIIDEFELFIKRAKKDCAN